MIYLTPKGKEKLEKELKELIKNRPVLAKRIERAKDMGDLKENAEYHDAKDAQGMAEGRIREIEAILNQAQVVEKDTQDGKVSLGSTIVVETNEKQKEYTIVGANEANPIEKKISSESPLGKAFLGHKKGDIVEAEVPAGKLEFKILEVK